MYHIETTDPITGNMVTQLMDKPFVTEDVKIEDDKDDTLVIYFESRLNRDLYLKNPTKHLLKHYQDLPDH
jgi:hypothetical protein